MIKKVRSQADLFFAFLPEAERQLRSNCVVSPHAGFTAWGPLLYAAGQ